jgi:hypothetical protein
MLIQLLEYFLNYDHLFDFKWQFEIISIVNFVFTLDESVSSLYLAVNLSLLLSFQVLTCLLPPFPMAASLKAIDVLLLQP